MIVTLEQRTQNVLIGAKAVPRQAHARHVCGESAEANAWPAAFDNWSSAQDFREFCQDIDPHTQ
jgi:hypothetical protein